MLIRRTESKFIDIGETKGIEAFVTRESAVELRTTLIPSQQSEIK